MKLINRYIIIICFIACSTEPPTIDYELKKFSKEAIASKIKYEDKFNLSMLYDSIKLQLPFEIDSSYIVSEWCGNAPRCKKYIVQKENVEIEICQQHQEVVHIPESKNQEHDHFYKMKYVEKLKENKNKFYGYETKHNLIYFDVFKSLNTESWKVFGVEIISAQENNTVMVNCVNKKTKSHYYSSDSTTIQLDCYTTMSIDFIKTQMETNEVLESIQFICERIKV